MKRKSPAPKALPVHIRMAIETASAICRRIAEKRLDMSERDALIKAVPPTHGASNGNR